MECEGWRLTRVCYSRIGELQLGIVERIILDRIRATMFWGALVEVGLGVDDEVPTEPFKSSHDT